VDNKKTMMRRHAKHPSFKEVHGHYRLAYGDGTIQFESEYPEIKDDTE
jgi:hypothetical protein